MKVRFDVMADAVSVVLVLLVYLVPSFIAYWRMPPNVYSVIVINVFLGWTLIGWVVALAMALRDVPDYDFD